MEILLLGVVVLITLTLIVSSIYSIWIGFEQWQYMHDPHKMLFLSSDNQEIQSKLNQIIGKYCSSTKDYNLVELGCGKAVVIKSLAQQHQWKSITGIEGQKSVWLQAWLNCLGLKQIQLLNQNIFDYTSQKPTFHYCYLGVKLMQELYRKGKFSHSIVISLDYKIEGIKPVETIELQTKGKIQNRLLVYLI
jgi:hypothetical protein